MTGSKWQLALLLAVAVAGMTGLVQAADEVADEAAAAASGIEVVSGVWQGPWYRGMTSGKCELRIEAGGGSIRFEGLDNFGQAEKPVTQATFDGKAYSFRTKGEGGSTLSATLKLNQAGTQMKGMGKYEGFTVRMEIRRVQESDK